MEAHFFFSNFVQIKVTFLKLSLCWVQKALVRLRGHKTKTPGGSNQVMTWLTLWLCFTSLHFFPIFLPMKRAYYYYPYYLAWLAHFFRVVSPHVISSKMPHHIVVTQKSDMVIFHSPKSSSELLPVGSSLALPSSCLPSPPKYKENLLVFKFWIRV